MSHFPTVNPAVVERIKNGDWSFGCAGHHRGDGSPECPWHFHHHHDEFCQRPNRLEVIEAGVDPQEFYVRSRA